MTNKALGRGLAALIKSDQKAILEVSEVEISKISPSSFQPREDFKQEALDELVLSIQEKGVIQPLIARKTDKGYELIAGERRLRAAKKAGLSTVPVIVRTADNKDSLVLSIVENVQRQQLNVIEEALAFKRLADEFAFSQEEISKAVGKDRASIANYIRLLKLPPEIQQEVVRDRISMGHAKALLALADTKDQLAFFEKVLKFSLNVRELERLIQDDKTAQKKTPKKARREAKDQHVASVEEELQHKIGTRVRININKKNQGTISVEFYSLDDLERIIKLIRK